MISYAITVHKAQGLSLDKVVLNITGKEFVPGMRYVAISRATKLQGIMFEQSFDLRTVRPIGCHEIDTMREADNKRRESQYLLPSDSNVATSQSDNRLRTDP